MEVEAADEFEAGRVGDGGDEAFGDCEEGGEGGEEARVGVEGVFAVEDWCAFGVDLFAGAEDVGAEAGVDVNGGVREGVVGGLDEDVGPDDVAEFRGEGEEWRGGLVCHGCRVGVMESVATLAV